MTPQTIASWEAKVDKMDVHFPLRRFRLREMSDEELLACSEAMSIGLSLDEMQSARDHFVARAKTSGRAQQADPTDVELEALGQAWSEHCCYKSSKPVLMRHVYGIHEEKIVAREDGGIVEFDTDWYYAVGLESHNHPSAIEPYGGAATGVGGIIRDIVCMGAQPVALVDPLFFGPLDLPHSELPPGVKHPRFLMDGVVAGIRDYGNRVGIPTVAGGVTFHPGYTGNCLVNVGCVGMVRKDKLMHSKAGGVGDVFVHIGNAAGRDGIHGVAFASEELSEGSEDSSRSAVQVGDSILKEPLIHVTLEVLDEGLVTGCKDYGGGGLSCVAGELAYDAGFGCEIDLDKIPTKIPGMAPWEIWVSESQERMMVTCKPESVDAILAIAKKWDVPAMEVGRVIAEPVNRVRYDGETVLELQLEFSTGGPVYNRPMEARDVPRPTSFDFEPAADLNAMLETLMQNPAIMSKEWVIRQYDHEVRANTVLKPLQGVIGSEGPGDATVLKPVHTSDKGMALSSDVNPRYMERDPYWGAASAIDETIRNLAAVGARVSSVCDNLNFGNPQKPERMWELDESARGLGDMARGLEIPFSSGNVSLYNETAQGPIPPTPTIMGIGILEHYKHATTMDLKTVGNAIFIIGETDEALGGSIYFEALGIDGGHVPTTRVDILKARAAELVDCIEAGLVRAAHDCSEGGIAVAAAEMCFAGQLGADLDLARLGDMRSDIKLFSESNTRWLVEVAKDKIAAFEDVLGKHAHRIGTVTLENLVIRDGDVVIDADPRRLRQLWAEALPRLMGVLEANA
jgi:phosphoribosylformylglycinamidine synthase II